MKTYPIAPNGIFHTIQGEGTLLGVPMVFVRLGGCSVGCPQCDTDYRVASRATAAEIAAAVKSFGCRWAFVTGGEPAMYDLGELLVSLKPFAKVAVVTSGHFPLGGWADLIDFLSVSPHDPAKWEVRSGQQLNLVPGLNGLKLADMALEYSVLDFPENFAARYVTPLHGSAESLRECMEWVYTHPGWRMGVQAHKLWGIA